MRRSFFVFVLCVFSLRILAQQGGQTSFNSLNIPGSARTAALGGNFIAMKDGDINLIADNPSLLDSATSGKLALGFVDYFAGTNLGYLSYARTLKKSLTLGGTMHYMSYGKTDETDLLGQTTGSFSAGDYIATIGAGYQVDSLFSLGANLRLIYSNIADFNAFATGVDLAGTYYKPSRNFTASLVIRNIGYTFDTFTDEDQDLPFEIQAGFTKRLRHAPFRFTITGTNLQKWDLTYNDPDEASTIDPITGEDTGQKNFEFGDQLMRHLVIGTECIISPSIHIRLGYNYRRRQELKVTEKPGMAGFSYGFGFQVKRFQLSYGRAIYHLAGPSNHFTVSMTLPQRSAPRS